MSDQLDLNRVVFEPAPAVNVVERFFASPRYMSDSTPPPHLLEVEGLPCDQNAYMSILDELPNDKQEGPLTGSGRDLNSQYFWETGAASFDVNENNRISVSIVSSDPSVANRIMEKAQSLLYPSERENSGKVSILVKGYDGIETRSLGYASVLFEEGNYVESSLPSIKEAISSLVSPFPDGRLVIIEGPPGGGKTFLIRSLVREAPNAHFLFVPPSMVPDLGSPMLVSVLLDLHSHARHLRDTRESSIESRPTILICEDADSVLTSRGMDNMSAVSSLLNLTSGLLGETMDIRVVATTNAPRSKIDEAVLRPGRLASYVQIPRLQQEQADKILSRLMGEDTSAEWSKEDSASGDQGTFSVGFGSTPTEVAKGVTLAEVYKVARRLGWSPEEVSTQPSKLNLLFPDTPRYAITSTWGKGFREGSGVVTRRLQDLIAIKTYSRKHY